MIRPTPTQAPVDVPPGLAAPQQHPAPQLFDADARARRRANRREARRARGEELSRRTVPLRKLIPNLITAGSLCAGIASLFYALRSARLDAAGETALAQLDLARALGAIVIAFVLDGLDGRMARLLKVTSRFGETFDSIADFTAFGVAPAFLIYQWRFAHDAGATAGGTGAMEAAGLGAAVLYTLCAAFRLARYTVQARRKRLGAPVSTFFQGMPAPAAGGAVLIPPMLELSSLRLETPAWVALVFMVSIALLMVSTIPMISIKGVRVSRSIVPLLLLGVAVLAYGIVADGWLTGAVFFGLYLVSFPLAMLLKKRTGTPGDSGEAATADSAGASGTSRPL